MGLQASKKGNHEGHKYSTPLLDEDTESSMASPRSKQSFLIQSIVPDIAPPPNPRIAGFGQTSISVSQELSKLLDDSADSDTKEILQGLRHKAVSCERELCEARLKVVQTEITRMEAEEAVILAKKTCFQKEAQ